MYMFLNKLQSLSLSLCLSTHITRISVFPSPDNILIKYLKMHNFSANYLVLPLSLACLFLLSFSFSFSCSHVAVVYFHFGFVAVISVLVLLLLLPDCILF